MIRRFLARQFARPSGPLGRYWIGPWLDRISREMNRLALRELALEPGERVLEVGFGGGGLLADILAAGCEAAGAEVSEAMLTRAKRRFAGELAARRLRLYRASSEWLPLANGWADKAASLNSLYFWPDPGAAMAELARVLRPGGLLVLAFEPPEELAKWPGSRFGFRACSEGAATALLAGAGFGPVRVAEGIGRKPDRFLCLSAQRLGANGW